MFLYDGDDVVLDAGGPGGFTLYVTPFLDQNLSMTRSGATFYYLQDGLGSVRTLTDSSGAFANRYDYTAWGEIFAPGMRTTLEQRYAFTGRERNPASPMMYYRYRGYAPLIGRFSRRDPAEDRMLLFGRNVPGEFFVRASARTPEVFNFAMRTMATVSHELDRALYPYVLGRPQIATDPLGLRECCCPSESWRGSGYLSGFNFALFGWVWASGLYHCIDQSVCASVEGNNWMGGGSASAGTTYVQFLPISGAKTASALLGRRMVDGIIGAEASIEAGMLTVGFVLGESGGGNYGRFTLTGSLPATVQLGGSVTIDQGGLTVAVEANLGKRLAAGFFTIVQVNIEKVRCLK